MRLRTLADVVACAAVHGLEPRIDATETQVRPAQGQPARSAAFVSGKRKQNTIKTTVVSDGQGRTLWAGAVRPGRVLDQTAVTTEGIKELLRSYRPSRPGWTPATGAGQGVSDRICVEHAIAEHKQWRPLQREVMRSPTTVRPSVAPG